MSKWYATLVQLTALDSRHGSQRDLVDENAPAGAQGASTPDLRFWVSDFLDFYRERFGEVLVLRESGPQPSNPSHPLESGHAAQPLGPPGMTESAPSVLIQQPASNFPTKTRQYSAPPQVRTRGKPMPHQCKRTVKQRVLFEVKRLLATIRQQQAK